MKTVIGLDYGTQSARAVLADVSNGKILREHSVAYAHGVMEGSLASAQDYEDALMELMEAVTPAELRDTIVGICVDATSLTLVPVSEDGRVLSMIPEYADREQAQIKLWKRHAAQKQADEALAKAQEMNERFLGRTGGAVSSEWMLPKLLEIRDEDPEIYEQVDIAFDLCEYLTWRLTGKLARSVGSMSYKGLWSWDLGFPSEAYLNALRPGFANEYAYKLRGEVFRPGQCIATVSEEMRKRFGLRDDVAVATGILDGHTALVAVGAMAAGDGALVVGTSNVLSIQTTFMCEMEGICGIALDGLTPGLYGIDSGQSGTGDMLEWYMKNSLPAEVLLEAKEKGISPHKVLEKRVSRPWESRVVVTDWFNGSRNAPCDLNLRGAMMGLSLDTKPEEIYLALLQAIVCGTREIIEQCAENGVHIDRLLATGGITGKNPLLMQEYANILNRTIDVAQVKEGPALGAAIFAAVAAGVYTNSIEAYEHMGVRDFVRYEPDMQHREEYEHLYRRNHALRNLVREAKAQGF